MNRLPQLSVLAALLLLAAAPQAAAAADPALLGLADPASNFVIGVDVQALAASPLAQEALVKAQTESSTWGQAMGALGPNPLSRIHEVIISGDERAARDQKKGLIVVRGDFGTDDWISVVCGDGCEEQAYQGQTLYLPPNAEGPGAFVRLDSNYVAWGTPDQVRGVIDRKTSGTGSSLAERVQGWSSSAGRHHVWVAAKGPFETPKVAGAGSNMMGMSGIANLDAFGMGLTLSEDLEVGIEMRSLSAAESQTLHQTLQGLMMVMSMSAQQDPDTAALLQGLTVGQSDRTLSASLRVPGQLLKRMVEKRVQQATSNTAAAWPTQPAPRQPRQGVIRIEGLDNGPVVVESAPKQ
jgi:hypothetical protein